MLSHLMSCHVVLNYLGSKPPTMQEAGVALMKSQGIAGFYRGIEANVMRAMVLNGTKMACYDQIKGEIVKSGIVPKGMVSDVMI